MIKEKVLRQIYQDGQHEFLVKVDFSKLDAAMFVKAIRSAQHRATACHGALVIEHNGRVGAPPKIPRLKKVAAP